MEARTGHPTSPWAGFSCCQSRNVAFRSRKASEPTLIWPFHCSFRLIPGSGRQLCRTISNVPLPKRSLLEPGFHAHRRPIIQLVTDIADSFRPSSVVLNGLLMPGFVHRGASGINTVFIAVIVDAIQWLDVHLVQKLVQGFPIVGPIADSFVFRPLEQLSTVTQQATAYRWYRDSATANNRVLHRSLQLHAMSDTNLEADTAISVQTRKELSKGAIIGPFGSVGALHASLSSYAPDLPSAVTYPRVAPRFAVNQNGAYRAIDDERSSGANEATSMAETITTPTFFYPAVVARAACVAFTQGNLSGAPCPAMSVALCDLTMAYRTIPTSQPWYTAFAFFDPLTNPPGPSYYWMPGHNFGLKSSVVNFNRYPELVVVTARVSFSSPLIISMTIS